MVAVAWDSHSPQAGILVALFPRRWCRAAWRHQLRAQAGKLLGAAGHFRDCWDAQNPDAGNLLTLSFLISHSLNFHSFLSHRYNFILMNLCFWLKKKCVLYEWSFYLSILCSSGISIFYTGNLGLKMFALEYPLLEYSKANIYNKQEYLVLLFHYTNVNKQRNL